MKERPILMSAPMVRAILRKDNPKTQTRRVVKPQPKCSSHEFWEKHPDFKPSINEDGSIYCGVCGGMQRLTETNVSGIRNPYGQPGDRIFVKEGWQTWTEADSYKPSEIPETWGINYIADGNIWASRRRNALFMPRWASRITLEITDVRVQRLQEISEDDILAEGVDEHLVKQIINPIAWKAGAVPEHWVHGWDEGFSFCRECAVAKVAELQVADPSGEYFLDGGWGSEGDSQPFCESCHRVLDNTFTTYACESELNHFRSHPWSLNPLDCLSLQNILCSYGWEDRDGCKFEDRLAADIHRIGFQAIWDSINRKKHPWSSNDWVWAVSFRRVP